MSVIEPPPAPVQTPPEEQFWKRYSPHGEAPLSFAGSLGLHGLAIGAMVLFGVWLAALFVKSDRKVPVEAVQLVGVDGGGGDPGGKGDQPGVGSPPKEDVGPKDVPGNGRDDKVPRLPPLPKPERQSLDKTFTPADVRVIADSDNPSARAWAKVEADILKKLREGLRPPAGKGGPGKDGGKDKGKGPKTGPGDGVGGKIEMTQREKRMVRWHMHFTANTGAEYLAQLRDLGAILAIPTREGPNPEYMLVEDLRPPAKLVSRDLSQINRIYWFDEKPRSVRDVMEALQLKMSPSRFAAFMPEKLEDELLNMERNHVEKVLRQKFDEDRIVGTHFQVVLENGRYRPKLQKVMMKQGR
jgi:hypothetical protein